MGESGEKKGGEGEVSSLPNPIPCSPVLKYPPPPYTHTIVPLRRLSQRLDGIYTNNRDTRIPLRTSIMSSIAMIRHVADILVDASISHGLWVVSDWSLVVSHFSIKLLLVLDLEKTTIFHSIGHNCKLNLGVMSRKTD